MFSPIFSSLDRMELLTYSYEIEQICALYYLNKISLDAAEVMIKSSTDLQLYNIMQSRHVNFRPSDLSSVWHDSNPWRYIIRLFQKGDQAVPERIAKERPILALTTHQLLGYSKPVFSGLEEKVTFIDIVRHPLYMIKQLKISCADLLTDNQNPRLFEMQYSHNDKTVSYYAKNWEELWCSMDKSNTIGLAIHYIDQLTRVRNNIKKKLKNKYEGQILTIPFEKFVLNPWPYLKQVEKLLGTKVTKLTRKMLRKQNVPRNKVSDGISLNVYKRFGWEPPAKGLSERDELNMRRQFAVEEGASNHEMEILDKISDDYENTYGLWF